MTPQRAVESFAAVARPVILRYFTRRSCIASCRIAIEVLPRFGVDASPVACKFVVTVPSLNTAYTSGLSREDRDSAMATAASFVDLDSGTASWNGHLVVNAGGFLIDPSFDQSLNAIALQGHAIDDGPYIAVFPSPLTEGMEVQAVTDSGLQFGIEYYSNGDTAYLSTPAWETDHLQPAINEILNLMRD